MLYGLNERGYKGGGAPTLSGRAAPSQIYWKSRMLCVKLLSSDFHCTTNTNKMACNPLRPAHHHHLPPSSTHTHARTHKQACVLRAAVIYELFSHMKQCARPRLLIMNRCSAVGELQSSLFSSRTLVETGLQREVSSSRNHLQVAALREAVSSGPGTLHKITMLSHKLACWQLGVSKR